MKTSELKTYEEALADDLKDPVFRREWNGTALARAVATRLVQDRAEHDLSQSALARVLGIWQPAIARLEAGEHNPSIEMLMRLSVKLDVRLRIEITPESVDLDLIA